MIPVSAQEVGKMMLFALVLFQSPHPFPGPGGGGGSGGGGFH